ncbi:MAG: hypothetical protein WA990_16320 [Rubrobacteraceae bacterium]
MNEGGRRGESGNLDWEGSVDLTVLSEGELKECLREIALEEQALSYHRRVLHGRIDLIRTELVGRGELALSPEELARILYDSPGTAGSPEGSGPDDEGGSD